MSSMSAPSPRRRRISWLLVIAFVVMPIIEIFVLIQVGQVIGVGWTFLLVIAAAIAGGWLVKREGSRAWNALRTALESGKMPATELADGALILVGGTLLVTPGFVTDAIGAALVLPITRPIFRKMLAALVARKVTVVGGLGGPGAAGFGAPGYNPRPSSSERVVPGEVVDD